MNALTRELRGLEPAAIERLSRAVLARSSLTKEEDLASLLARLEDREWQRASVRTLDAGGRLALRILTRARHGVDAPQLDGLARLAIGDEPAGAVEQLFASGLVHGRIERLAGRPTMRLRVFEALRPRLLTLATEPPLTPPPPPDEKTGMLLERRFEFALGALLAAIRSHQPRATRLGGLHRTDARQLAQPLAALFGDVDGVIAAVSELLRAGCLKEVDGRIEPDPGLVLETPARVLLHRLRPALRDGAFSAPLGRLLARDEWVSYAELVETAAVALASSGSSYGSMARWISQVLEELEHSGATLTIDHEGRRWWRLAAFARRVLEGSPSTRQDAAKVLVQPNLQLVAPLELSVEGFLQLGSVARLLSADQVATFVIDEPSVKRATKEGLDAATLLGRLERHASHGVPSTVVRALSDWARPSARARLLVGAVLTTDADEASLRRLAGDIALQRIADGTWLLRPGDAGPLATALRQAGWGVEHHAAPVDDPFARPPLSTRALADELRVACEKHLSRAQRAP